MKRCIFDNHHEVIIRPEDNSEGKDREDVGTEHTVHGKTSGRLVDNSEKNGENLGQETEHVLQPSSSMLCRIRE